MKALLQDWPPLRGLLPLIGVLALWQLAAGEQSPNFPPPSSWYPAVAGLAARGLLAPAVAATLSTFILGLALATVVGFALGLLIGAVESVRRWSSMLLEYLRALPPPVLVPIAVLLVGYTETMKVAVVTLTALWPVLLNTVAGVAEIPDLMMDVARSLHLTWRERLLKIVVPAALPALLLGIRNAVPLALVITLLVEMLTGLPGIGKLMILGQRNFSSPQVFALLAIVGVLGFVLNLVFLIAENLVLRRWPPRPVIHG